MLTSADAAAIKAADTLCFDTIGERTTIRAITRATERVSEVVTTIGVDHVWLNDYSGASGDYTAYATLMNARHDDVTRTMARHLRKGSVLALRWTRGNDSPVTREAGLVVDHLDVVVSNGKAADTFRVATYIGRDNSVRMVKRG